MPITNKFFVSPFADVGDVAPIPNTIQPSGSISYPQGFTVKYELDPTIDPTALEVPRLQTNQVLLDATNALKQYQISGVPNFITTADNLGTPWSYDKYAKALYNDGFNGLRPYVSLVDLNTSLPTDQTKWVVDTLNPQTLRSGEFIAYTSTGIPNALSVNPSDAYLSTLSVGTQIKIIANASNTNTTTLDISNGSGPIPINMIGPVGLIPLSGGEIINTGIYDLVFNGTVWVLTNSSLVRSSNYASVSKSINEPFVVIAPTKVSFDVIESDPNGWYDNINNRFIPNKIGWYEIRGSIFWNTSTQNGLRVYKNGSTAKVIGQSQGGYINGSTIFNVITLGDYFEIYVVPTSPMTISGDTMASYFQINYIGN